MAPNLVLAIDQGTTGTTALLVDPDVRVLAARTVDFPNHYPRPGEVEHDPAEIWTSVEGSVRGVLHAAGVEPGRIAAVGITNQRETGVIWDRTSGDPIHRALVWQDRRTADVCAQLRAEGAESLVRDRAGLVLDPYFSATKVAWVLDHVPGARGAAEAGRLQFGTIDSWLTWRMTGAHVTDVSNASRTSLMSLTSLAWDSDLLDLFRVPSSILPRIVDSSGVVGVTQGLGFLPDGIPVAGLIGDQQGALFGQACFRPGMAKCTYGTGAFILLNTGDAVVPSGAGMLTTVGWRVGEQTTYALEGSAFIAGAAVQWLRDGLGILTHASEVEALAAQVPDAGGVIFVPALTGLGAPHWRAEARGALLGLTRGTTRAHIARAVLEGVALQLVDILDAMAQDAGSLTEIRVDGGASANGLLMQRQADLLGVPCVRPVVRETTALGSALLAGLATGVWGSLDEVAASWQVDRRFEPGGDPAEISDLRTRWREAVAKA
jgi:glycerol kinase